MSATPTNSASSSGAYSSFNTTAPAPNAIFQAVESGDEALVQHLIQEGAPLDATNDKGKTPLHLACCNGNPKIVELLVKAGANIDLYVSVRSDDEDYDSEPCSDCHDDDTCEDYSYEDFDKGTTPLHLACEYGHTAIVSLLLQTGAKIDSVDDYENTPLDKACEYGHTAAVSLLLEAGAKADAVDRFGQTHLDKACEHGHTATINLLLQAGAKVNVVNRFGYTPLHTACRVGNITNVNLLLQAGAMIDGVSSNEKTPLCMACRFGHANIVSLLLKANATVNPVITSGQTPLHEACSSENTNTDIVNLLLQAGAKIDAVDNFGQTPLLVAAFSPGNTDIVNLLLQAGAKIDAVTSYGSSPLHLACSCADEALINLLLGAGANPNAVDIAGETPLHRACQIKKTNISIFELLLKAGANPNAIDFAGATPLHLACRKGYTNAIKPLLQAGANPNAVDYDGETPLYRACKSRNTNITTFELLLRAGAKTDVVNIAGETPLHFASRKGRSNAVKILLQAGASLKAISKNGYTPLKLAYLHRKMAVVRAMIPFYNGIPGVIEALLAGEGAINTPVDGTEATPLKIACSTLEHFDIVELLIQRGASLAPGAHDPQLSISLNLWFTRLKESPDFTSPTMRPYFIKRVLSVLHFAMENSEYLEAFKLILEESTSTCTDRAALYLNSLELKRKLMQSSDLSESAVIHLMRGSFAIELLEKVATRKVNALRANPNGLPIYPIEIFLAFQVGLREKLELPIESHEMYFARISQVSQADLDAAETEVRTALNEKDSFKQFLLNHKEWTQRLTKNFPAEKAAFLKDLDMQMEKLEDELEEGIWSSEDYLKECNSLRTKFDAQEKIWFEKKTEEVLMRGSSTLLSSSSSSSSSL